MYVSVRVCVRVCVRTCMRVPSAFISDVWNRQRGGLQVPPQRADGEEASPALQGEHATSGQEPTKQTVQGPYSKSFQL